MWIIVKAVLICLCISLADSIFCYQCADSSDKAGKNQCQTYVRTMNRYRERYYETSSINKYVKNCTGYKDLHELDVYCMIMEVKSRDNVRSYIRGCTDGVDFLDVDASIEIDEKVNFNNKTQCVNIKNGMEACITICSVEHGDFCNGYVSEAVGSRPCLIVLLWTFCAAWFTMHFYPM